MELINWGPFIRPWFEDWLFRRRYVMGDISASCDCMYDLSAAHYYRVGPQQIMLTGLVFNWP